MTKDEALALALEALESCSIDDSAVGADSGYYFDDLKVDAAITAIKQAQQAQEPVKRKRREMTEEMRDFHARGLLSSLTFWCHLPVEDSDELARFMHKYVSLELAAPKQAEPEHSLNDTRCECCGYMTYHREHMGCIRAAAQNQG